MTEDTAPNQEQQAESQETASAIAEPADEQAADNAFEDHFRPVDIDQFTEEDTIAGSAIGKMLAWFFLYTVIVMSISAWWTFSQSQ